MSAAILGLVAIPLTEIFYSGLQTLDAQLDDYLSASAIRSRMELLLSTDFDSLADGSIVVTLPNRNVTMSWTILPLDLDSDWIPEPDVRHIKITLDDKTLSTIVTAHNGDVEKIP